MATAEVILSSSSNAYDANEKDMANDIKTAFKTAKTKIASGLPGITIDLVEPSISSIVYSFRQRKDKGDKTIRTVDFVVQVNSAQLTLVARREGGDEGCGGGVDIPRESDDLAKVKERRAFLVALNKFNKKLLSDGDLAAFNKKHPPGLEEAVENLGKLKEAQDKLKKMQDEVKTQEAKVKDLQAKVKPYAAQLAKIGKK